MPALENLVTVDQKVFAKHGQTGRLPHGSQIVEGALKVFLVGEYAETSGSVAFVSGRHPHGIEVGADDAGGGGGSLDLGDQGDGRLAARAAAKSRTGGAAARLASRLAAGRRRSASSTSARL